MLRFQFRVCVLCALKMCTFFVCFSYLFFCCISVLVFRDRYLANVHLLRLLRNRKFAAYLIYWCLRTNFCCCCFFPGLSKWKYIGYSNITGKCERAKAQTCRSASNKQIGNQGKSCMANAVQFLQIWLQLISIIRQFSHDDLFRSIWLAARVFRCLNVCARILWPQCSSHLPCSIPSHRYYFHLYLQI